MIINGYRHNDDNASNLNQWEKIGTFSLNNIVLKNTNVGVESVKYFSISINQSITKMRLILKKNFSVSMTPDTSKITSYGPQINMNLRLWLNDDPEDASAKNMLLYNTDAQFHYQQKTPVNTIHSTDIILCDTWLQENNIFHFSNTNPQIKCIALDTTSSNDFIYQIPIFYEVSMEYTKNEVGFKPQTGYGTITIDGDMEIYVY